VPDPLTQLYDNIVSAFKSECKGRFRLVNWNSSRNPQLDRPAAADLPEVQIRPIGANVILGARSCSTVVTCQTAITLTTGDYILGKALFPIEWLIIGILYRLQYSLVAENVRIESVTTGITDPSAVANRGITGWASQWNISVDLAFGASSLGE
jgi:hypothetical protein